MNKNLKNIFQKDFYNKLTMAIMHVLTMGCQTFPAESNLSFKYCCAT